ncbi:hypothetical protein WDU94_008340 [Cyamophila willieti]
MTKHKNEKSGSRQSVFERLGGKSSSKTIVYCSAWLKTGTCPNGKSCKYVNSHINLSGSGTSGHNFKSKMKPHSSGKNKDRSGGSPEAAWDNWDQADLEYADEKVLEKRLELLRRELLNAEVKTESHSSSRTKHHSRSKHKVVEKKRKASTSSSSSSSSSSQSSSSSSSSSSEEEAQSSARFKHAKPRHSPSSSPSPTKHKPRSFQKHNKEKRVASPEKKARNPKAFGTSKGFQKNSPVKGRHRTPPPKRKASPVKQSRAQQVTKKDKGRSAYSPPPHKRDRKSHSPALRRAPNDKKPHSPKRGAPRTPPHRTDNRRKSPPVRGGDNRRPGNTVARKSPPLRRNIDNRNADRGKQPQKIVKGRFDKNNKDDNRRNVSHDKRDDDRMRERIRVEVKRDIRRDSPGRDKKREIDNRRDKDRDIKTRQDRDRLNEVRRHKEPDRFAKTSRSDPPGKQSSHPPGREGREDRRPPPSTIHSHPARNVNSARTPAQGRILDRILERKQYLTGDKDRSDKDRLRDRGLDRVHSEHRSRAGSREGGYEPTTSGLRGRDEPTRFPSDERSPSLRHPDDRRPWADSRRGGSYDEGEEEWEGRKWGGRGGNRRVGGEWDRNKDWGPGEWNDGLELPASGRPSASRPGRGAASKRELKEGRSGEDLEEVLSDISDDADEILNRDEEVSGSESPVSDDEPDFKMSTLICGPMQDPLTQRLLADDFDLDFEDASDDDLETKATIGDALGVDWASLVQETKPQTSSQEETGSAKKRWEPAQIFARLGLSESMAGKETVERIKAKYGLDGSSNIGETQQDLDSAPVLLHSMPGVHCALRDKIKARRQMFDPLRRALHARHDLSIRKQVAGFPVSLLPQTAAIAS